MNAIELIVKVRVFPKSDSKAILTNYKLIILIQTWIEKEIEIKNNKNETKKKKN